MSRSYRIRISESLERHIEVADGLRSKLEILEVLPPEQTAELLAAELDAAGFELCEDDGQWTRVDKDGVEVRVDPREGTVDILVAAEEQLALEREREISVWAENDAGGRQRGERALRAELEGQVEAREQRLQTKVTKKLEGKLGDLRRELDQIGNKVTVEALKRKAASMGEIQEISEDPETGSLTIRVKI